MTLHPEQLAASLVPLDRDPDPARAARMPVADPLWFLLRQAEMGEFAARDVGTPALLRLEGESNTFTATRAGPTERPAPYDPRVMPLEMRVGRDEGAAPLRHWDTRRLSLGREIARLLRDAGLPPEVRKAVAERFPLPTPSDPRVGKAARAVALHRGGRGFDGVGLLDMVRNAPIDDILIAAGIAVGDPAIAVVQEGLSGLLREELNRSEAGAPTWRDASLDHEAEILVPQGNAEPIILARPDILTDGVVTDVAGIGPIMMPGVGVLGGIDLGALLGGQGSTLPDISDLILPDLVPTRLAVLRINDHRSGPLDWWDMDFSTEASLPAAEAPRPAPPFEVTAIPVAARFPGMPLARLWSVEPPETNYGHLDPAPEDLARLVVAEFALGGARNWFIAPFGVLAGSVTRMRRVVFRDTFGREAEAREVPAEDGRFVFCRNVSATDGRPETALVVSPVLPHHHRGPVIERVDLVRDPGANLVWAVEAQAPDAATGLTVDRTEQVLAAPRPPDVRRAPTEAQMAYRIAGDVPENRFPYEMPPDLDHRKLVRARLFDAPRNAAADPSGEILRAPSPINDEAVPPGGVRIERAPIRVRWTGGSVRAWTTRERLPRKPQLGSSGLRFDTLSPVNRGFEALDTEFRISFRDVASYAADAPQSLSALLANRSVDGSFRSATARLAEEIDQS
ncbi:hypothetical protein ILP92_06720 [Maribius pontilimi]|uniref:Uncharacterized protein n=1 Tax=Palleronia pontilimi TaxID=1964209 RepID=A0A934MCF0_9RHOB|nr:hypothetical protein [Palleronia pontilimi]MBJ3762435.1 hypothetical protein [Palleronia pontilimi]